MLGDLLGHLTNGLAIGSTYALLALGFTLVFGVAYVINFAQGSLFMVGAYLAWTGVGILGLPLAVAGLLSVALVMLLGVTIDLVGLRPLRHAPHIAPLLSTLGISLILDQLAEIIWSPEPKAFPSPLSDRVLRLDGAFFSAVDLATLIIGLLAVAALWLFLNRTWAGSAIRAAAQDPDTALQMGIRVNRVRTMVFGIAGALGALGGIMAGMYYQSIFPTMGLPFGIKGFVAAVIGGIASVPGAIAGGLLLGVLEGLTGGYIGMAYRDMIAYALLLIVLLVKPQGLFGSRRLESLGGRQGAAGAVPTTSPLAANSVEARPWVFNLSGRQFLAVGVLVALVPLFAGPYVLRVGALSLIFALLSLSVSMLAGTAGRISIGHAAFWGIGSYVTAIFANRYGLPLEVALLTSGALAAFAAFLTAIPLTRLSGFAVLLGSLAVGEIFRLIFLNWVPVTRGPMGIFGIPDPMLSLGGIELGLAGKYWMALVLLAFGVWVVRRMQGSLIGTAWRSIREDTVAARSSGVPMSRYLNIAFGVSGFLAGIAGSQYAYLVTVIHPDSFMVIFSITLLTMAVIGGLGNPTGAIIGGVVLSALPEVLRGFDDYRMVAYGLLLVLIVRFRPRGLVGTM